MELKGAIELHAHSSPSIFPRKQTDWELLEDVDKAGMGGIVLKAHEGSTVERTFLLQEKYPDLIVAGGLVCNLFTGGVSPVSVDMALRMGAKIIWMPTLSSKQHKKYFAEHEKPNIFNSKERLEDCSEGLTIMKNNQVDKEVKKVLELIAKYDAVLATGHLSSKEVLPLVEEAKKQGVNRVLIQHADLGIAPLTISEQKHLASSGCIIEKCYLACSNDFQDITVAKMAQSIREIGADNCVLVTDYGQSHHKPVVEAFGEFISKMKQEGVSSENIKKMVNKNPRYLIQQ